MNSLRRCLNDIMNDPAFGYFLPPYRYYYNVAAMAGWRKSFKRWIRSKHGIVRLQQLNVLTNLVELWYGLPSVNYKRLEVR